MATKDHQKVSASHEIMWKQAQNIGNTRRSKIRQSFGACQVLFIDFENRLFIHDFAHLHTLSQIHPPPLDSNPRKSLWVNGGDVATSKCPRIDLDQKSFLRSKVQLFIYILRGTFLPMILHSQEAIEKPY